MGSGWVLFGYIVTYGAIIAYAALLVARTRMLGRHVDHE